MRWEALLRAEPVTSPLALPDALVHLIDTTLEEIFAGLANPADVPLQLAAEKRPAPPSCACGRNPFLAYFTAGRQAVLEGLILAQAACAPLDPVRRDASLNELNDVLHRLMTREVEAFCGVCQFRRLAPAAAESIPALCG